MAKKSTNRSNEEIRGNQQEQGAQGLSPVHRVWKLDAALKEGIAEKRASRKQTVKEFVAEAIQGELPDVVQGLADLGVTNEHSDSVSPVRFPMLESSLAALRYASEASGLSQSQLLIACLRQSIRRKRRRPSH